MKFNENNGSTINDLVGNNPGTIIGDPVWSLFSTETISLLLIVLLIMNFLSKIPNYEEYEYKISAKDTAGNISQLSDAKQSIPASSNLFSLEFDGLDDYMLADDRFQT